MNELVEMRRRIAAYRSASTGDEMGPVSSEIRDQVQNLEAIINAVNDGIFLWELNTDKLEWDERLHSLVGDLPDSFSAGIGELLTRIHPDDVVSTNQAIHSHLDQNQRFLTEFRLRQSGGDYIWVMASGQATRDEQGQPIKLIASITDINQSRQSTESRFENESRLDTLFKQLQDAILVVEPGGKIVQVNSQASTVLGYGATSLQGMNIMALIQPNYVTKWIGISAQIAERRNIAESIQMRAVGNAVLTVDMKVALLPDGNILVSLQEEPEQDEDTYSQARMMEGFERFARGLAHELNNMLTPVMGYAELSEKALSEDSSVRNYIQEIQKSADRTANLARQLLAFARQQVIHPEVVNLNDLIRNLEIMMRRLIGEGIELRISAEQNLWNVRVDPSHVEQALVNLALNARDAMPNGGRLILETSNATLSDEQVRHSPNAFPGDYVCLAVSDTGVGMTEEVKVHALEPFFTTKKHGEGAGMGLSASYGIVSQNQGLLEVLSEQGQGTTFKMYFPRSQ